MTCPERGDLIWTDFNPQAGHEQAGERPALVLSPKEYNSRLGLAIVCPITSQTKGYAFAVPLPAGGDIQGNVLAHQVTSIDWRVRGARIAERAPQAVIDEVLAKLLAIIEPDIP